MENKFIEKLISKKTVEERCAPKKRMMLQLFTEGGDDGTDGETDGGTDGETDGGGDGGSDAEKKYTDDDVDKLIAKKYAEWQKKHEKKASEAERLAKMTAEEKAEERMKSLEKRIAEYEKKSVRDGMVKQARSILNEKNIHVSDELIANLIGEDAETTKASVDNFVSLFNDAVENALKERLKGKTPTTGTPTSITKEQIMAVKNRAERQRLINEHIDLFK